MGRKFGVTKVLAGVPTVSPDTVEFGKPIEYPYSIAVMSEDECHAHPFGESLKIGGVWYWRNFLAELRPIADGNAAETNRLAPCKCPITGNETKP